MTISWKPTFQQLSSLTILFCLIACDHSPVHIAGQRTVKESTESKKEERHDFTSTPPIQVVPIGRKLRVDLTNENFDCHLDLQGVSHANKVEDIKNPSDYLIADKSKLPCFSYTSSEVPFVKFPDGRVAIVAASKKLFKNLTATGKVTDVSCLNLDHQVNCAGMSDIFIDDYRMIWIKHPSQKKIGQHVKVFTPQIAKAKNNIPIDLRDPLNASVTMSIEKLQKPYFVHNKTSAEVLEKISPNTLYCEYYDWFRDLSTKQKNDGKNLLINEWSKETMADNPETNLPENRTFGSALNVEMNLVKRSTPYITTSKIGFVPSSGDPFSFDNLFFGEVVGWNINLGKKSCDISFNFDLAQLSANFQKITTGDLDKKYHPYSISKEEMSTLMRQGGSSLPKISKESPLSALASLNIITYSHTTKTTTNPDGSEKLVSYSSISVKGAQ